MYYVITAIDKIKLPFLPIYIKKKKYVKYYFVNDKEPMKWTYNSQYAKLFIDKRDVDKHFDLYKRNNALPDDAIIEKISFK